MTDWNFLNHERKRLGIKLNWKSVSAGEIIGNFTILTDGRGKESVEARCSCGNVGKYTAASLKGGGRKGGVSRCPECDKRVAESLVWRHPKKWKNPNPRSEQDMEAERVKNDEAKRKKLNRKDKYG